ncbi:four-carbon acid sugar kinase family protein [Geosporobacter ferrireducens]|uniref:four-carbon acid sugar kinase family protein n=1 Tax=Geosporobacter ferrireducens TaxID=1424294 RepID=UPI00139C974E|nr:four-carbon acid sugar kinase family protein [Geosporobacter ferrireducens]MTI54718.1 four-carbon acid sugar kinase family protein [Geosporobacter ferrireducens]
MIYIIADDLTGANDTGVQYKRRGLRTLISAEADLPLLYKMADNFDVISINADTRTKIPNHAYRTTYDLVKHIQTTEHEYIYKKVDSLVRGNAAQELEAVMDALDAPLAVVAISYPANARTLCNGTLVLPDTNGVSAEIDVIKLFAEEMKRKVQGISLATVRKGKDAILAAIQLGQSDGTAVFVVDAVTDEDLARIRDVALALENKTVMCGSAGLANQLSLLKTRDVRTEGLRQEKDGIILIMIGSRNACTAEQIQALTDETGMPVITTFTSEILSGHREKVCFEVLQQADNLIAGGCKLLAVVVDTLFLDFKISLKDSQDTVSDSLKIAETMGSLAKLLYDRYSIDGILSSGGDTSLAILKALGAKGIELDSEILPGVPMGKLIGGKAEGMTIVTKSGGFGPKDCLIRSIEYLKKQT